MGTQPEIDLFSSNFYRTSKKWERGIDCNYNPGDLKLSWYKPGDPTIFEIVTEKTNSISHLIFGRLFEGNEIFEKIIRQIEDIA